MAADFVYDFHTNIFDSVDIFTSMTNYTFTQFHFLFFLALKCAKDNVSWRTPKFGKQFTTCQGLFSFILKDE